MTKTETQDPLLLINETLEALEEINKRIKELEIATIPLRCLAGLNVCDNADQTPIAVRFQNNDTVWELRESSNGSPEWVKSKRPRTHYNPSGLLR